MKNLSFSLKYLHYVTGVREAAPLRISGVGLREAMSPGRVERPAGTRDRFLVLFHTPVELFRRGGVGILSGRDGDALAGRSRTFLRKQR